MARIKFNSSWQCLASLSDQLILLLRHENSHVSVVMILDSSLLLEESVSWLPQAHWAQVKRDFLTLPLNHVDILPASGFRMGMCATLVTGTLNRVSCYCRQLEVSSPKASRQTSGANRFRHLFMEILCDTGCIICRSITRRNWGCARTVLPDGQIGIQYIPYTTHTCFCSLCAG